MVGILHPDQRAFDSFNSMRKWISAMKSLKFSADSFAQAFKYGIAAANLCFRTLWKHGAWIPGPDRSVVVHARHKAMEL